MDKFWDLIKKFIFSLSLREGHQKIAQKKEKLSGSIKLKLNIFLQRRPKETVKIYIK